jgi:hypothetical protein
MAKDNKKYQTVELHGWYAWPVYCPFCGQPSFDGKEDHCKHVLYVYIQGMFVYCGERFSEPGLGRDSINAIDEINLSENNHIEFRIYDPGDTARIGFASLDEELCGWGREPVDPRT